MTLSPNTLRIVALAAVSSAALAVAGTVVIAQTAPLEPVQWDRRALDRLDRNVRRLERALTQRNAAGQPVLLEPDPETIALQGQTQILDRRLGDMEATVQRVNADLERLTFAVDEAREDNAALRRRLSDAERRIAEMERAAAAAREEAALNGPITANSPTGDAAQDLAAAVTLSRTDARRGARALETVVVTWPDTPQAREANVRLGDLRAAADDDAGAVQAYAAALQGWPRAGWAAETTLKLAEGLIVTDRRTQACAALGEFTRRYGEGAAALRTRATQLRTRAQCG
ncbi:tetratricopeptide repeat protein [Brevundimonas balnearis]|uniref:Tol-pal system YbgF family protein n=1 Tax=Brevundimonas balnearis TaxID=1572858 RepID=A0ABV6R1E6_9CAUL